MILEILPLGHIDLFDERFRISYFFRTDVLENSLEKSGLLHPVIVVERDGRLVLLAGWKRTIVLKDLGAGTIEAIILEQPDDRKAFRRAVSENSSLRSFSFLEKAMIVRRFLEMGEREDVLISSILPLLRLTPEKATLEILGRVAESEEDVRRFFQEKDVSFETAAILAGLTAAGRSLVVPLLVPLGRNKRGELLEDLVDIAAREGKKPEEILSTPPFLATAGDTRLSPLQRSERIRTELNREKNPRFWNWKDGLDKSLGKLGLPPKTGIRTSPAFEDEEMTLAFSFRTAGEFREKIEKIGRISNSPEFDELFREGKVPPE